MRSLLALVAAHAHGRTVFRQVSELTKKESNRLDAIIEGLDSCVDAWCENDDLFIDGQPKILSSRKDSPSTRARINRLAMTWVARRIMRQRP